MEGLLLDVSELPNSKYLCFVQQGTRRQEYFLRGRDFSVSLHSRAVKISPLLDVDVIAAAAAEKSKRCLALNVGTCRAFGRRPCIAAAV